MNTALSKSKASPLVIALVVERRVATVVHRGGVLGVGRATGAHARGADEREIEERDAHVALALVRVHPDGGVEPETADESTDGRAAGTIHAARTASTSSWTRSAPVTSRTRSSTSATA